MTKHPTIAISAPGKVFLAGGYLALDRAYTALVFGLSARINVIAGEIHTGSGVQLNEIVVDSPQFLDAQWRYGYHRAAEGGGIQVTQLLSGEKSSKNPFVETTLSYALTYIDHIASRTSTALKPARLIILADNDYYSTTSSTTSNGRFAKFGVPLSAANKTGLGSSAALVTALTASLLTHYLPKELFDATSKVERKSFTTSLKRHTVLPKAKRFSPGVLGDIPEPGAAEFVEKLAMAVEGTWDVEVNKDGVAMPPGVVLRMCDVDCGSQTVGMVKNVLKWRSANPEKSTALWDELQGYNTQLAQNLKEHDTAAIPETVQKIRKMIREMSTLSEVPIEPASQTALLDGVTSVDGVFGGVVPGAGGFDAAALLMKDDGETEKGVEEFLRKWTDERDANVKLLNVKGEMEGVRRESLDVYDGWL